MRNIDERYSKAALISVQRIVERESLKESLAGYYEFRPDFQYLQPRSHVKFFHSFLHPDRISILNASSPVNSI